MNEFPSPEMDVETAKRMDEAWESLALGYVAQAKRDGISPIKPLVLIFPLEWRNSEFNVNIFSTLRPKVGELPTNLELLLIQDNSVKVVTMARLEWTNNRPSVLSYMAFQTLGTEIPTQNYIHLINTAGALLEQPHNTI